jgi:hypothetical protein
MTNHNVEKCKKKKEQMIMVTKGNPIKSKIAKDIFICMSHIWSEWTLNGRLSKVS